MDPVCDLLNIKYPLLEQISIEDMQAISNNPTSLAAYDHPLYYKRHGKTMPLIFM